MITILNKPYTTQPIKIQPVYNGLGFVVDSNKKAVPNFRYIAEIYADSTKIGELKHNPDISASNYGIFDIGRIVENYIDYDLAPTSLQSQNFSNMPYSLAPYYIRFGEEFSRISALTAVANGTGANAGKLRITTPYQHNLSSGDRIQLIGTSVATYNTWSPVTVINTTQFIMTDVNYTTAASVSDAYFIQGETITAWSQYTGADGAFYLRLTVKVNSSFNVGDLIQIRQDRKNQSGATVAVVNTNYENVEWTIVSKVSGPTTTQLNTNVPYGANIASNIWGSIISRNNFVILNQISTQNDGAYAFGGVAQYDTFLTYSVAPYIFNATQSLNQFLTTNPNRELDICKDEYFTLAYFGQNIIKITQPTNIGNRRIRVETYSTPNGLTYSATSIFSDSSISAGKLGLTFSGNLSNDLTTGSELTLYHNAGQLNTTILKSSASGGNTGIILDTPYVIYTGSYIKITTKIKQYDALLASNMGQIGVGPLNLNLASTEINDGTCFKYKVYSILYGSNSFLSTTWSETWTFNIKDCCKTGYQFTWLGELGTFEYFTFDGRLDKLRSIEKQDWRRHLKEYKQAQGYTYNMGDRGITTFNTKSFDEWTIRSRFLTQKELDWLVYIYESPEVYLINGGNLIPITITNTEVNLFNKANVGEMGRIYYYTITFRLSNDRVIQRG